jgi:hypothetical protein
MPGRLARGAPAGVGVLTHLRPLSVAGRRTWLPVGDRGCAEAVPAGGERMVLPLLALLVLLDGLK